MKLINSLNAIGLCLAALTPLASAQVPSLDARVDIDIVERDLSEVVQYLREKSGANIVVLEGGERKVETLKLSDVYWRHALDYAAESAGCVVEEDQSGVLTISSPYRVEFVFDDQDIREVISTIAKAADANVVIAPEVEGTVRLRLKNVPWRDALEQICEARGYTVVEKARNILSVVDPAQLERQKVTRSYQLRYIRPKSSRAAVLKSEFVEGQSQPPIGPASEHFSILAALDGALSDTGDLTFIESQNVILVRDTTQVHETIQEILRRLDVEPGQIFVDLKFVSTANSDLLNLGVDYGDEGARISISGSQIPIELPFSMGEGGWEDSIIASDTGFGPYAGNSTVNGAPINPGQTQVPATIFGALNFNQVQAVNWLVLQEVKLKLLRKKATMRH